MSGEPGIGKSTLLADAATAAVAAGVEVRRAGADERDGGRTYTLLLALLPELADGVGLAAASRLPGALDFAIGPRLETADIVAARVEELRSRGPLLLVVDDLQWADPESLLALAAIVRRASSAAVGVIAAFRPSPMPAELHHLVDLARAADATEVAVGPLSTAASRQLAVVFAGTALEPSRRTQVESAGGNPWLIRELVAHAGAAPGDPAPAASADAGLVPPAVRDAVRRRLRGVDDDVATYLRAAAVLGGGFAVEDLAALVDQPVGRVAIAMARAVDAGFLDDVGARLRFRHDLFRQALECELPASAARALHRAAATVLRQSGASSLHIAPHLVLGARPGDDEALTWLTEAAEDAARHSPATAADLLAHAAEVCGPDESRRRRIEVLRAHLLVWAGRPGDAEALTARGLAGELDADTTDDLRTIRARALFLLGRAAEANELLVAHQGERAVPSPDHIEAQTYAEVALLRLFAGNPEEAATLAASAIAEDPDDLAATTLAHNVLGWTSMFSGRAGEARIHVEAALEVASDTDLPEVRRFVPHLFAAIVQNSLGDTPGARLTLRSGRAISARLDFGWDRAMYDWAESVVAFMAGEWSDALALGEAGTVGAEESGLQIGALWHLAIGAIVSVRRGDQETARSMLARADALAASGTVQLGFDWYAWAHATALIDAGAVDVGVSLLDGAWQVAERSGARQVWHLLGIDLAAAALTIDRPDLASRTAEGLAALAATSELPLHRGLAMHATGLRDGDAAVLVAAADVLEPVRRPFDHARAAGHAAIALADAGRAEEARRQARRALAVFDELGAGSTEARLREALRERGVVVRGATRRRADATGWDALTKTERSVVQLVALGLSNGEIAERLFVSRRTVESHLVHVYAKVGARSRVELARHAAERDRGA